MSIRAFTIGVVALALAVPVAAQQRGTIEFGGFGSVASFDNVLSLETAYGGGGRVGMYLAPRLAVEFEKGGMRASRPEGLADVNVGILSGRVVATPATVGPLALLTGFGALVSTETNFMHTYGMDALAGLKLALGNNAALRVDGVWNWLANEDWKSYQTVRVGISLFRHPHREMVTVTTVAQAPAPVVVQAADSVSAAEIRRLRASDAALIALRDSLALTSGALATIEDRIHFAHDQSALSNEATALLREKVTVLRANPSMRILIVGFTSEVGTEAYNMNLGFERSQAARAYLVSQGIAMNRIQTGSGGQGQLLMEGPSETAAAMNRRAEFRIQVTDR